MTTYIKMMSAQNLPDTDPYKNYTMYTLEAGEAFRFTQLPFEDNGSTIQKDVVQIKRHGSDSWETIEMFGNVYVMNTAGKTIATHGISHKPIGSELPISEIKAIGDETTEPVAAPQSFTQAQDNTQRGVTAGLTQLTEENITKALSMAYSKNKAVLSAASKFIALRIS